MIKIETTKFINNHKMSGDKTRSIYKTIDYLNKNNITIDYHLDSQNIDDLSDKKVKKHILKK